MNCPSCQKPASFVRVTFTLQGVPFSKSMQGYSRCEHCGTLLRISNLNLTVIIQTVAGLVSVGLYALLFQSIGTWIGFTSALVLFFPYLFIVGITVTYIAYVKFSTHVVVHEDAEKGVTSG